MAGCSGSSQASHGDLSRRSPAMRDEDGSVAKTDQFWGRATCSGHRLCRVLAETEFIGARSRFIGVGAVKIGFALGFCDNAKDLTQSNQVVGDWGCGESGCGAVTLESLVSVLPALVVGGQFEAPALPRAEHPWQMLSRYCLPEVLSYHLNRTTE